MDNLHVVMPAYNEEAIIEKTIRDWYPIVADKGEGSKLVVADSGSTDSTHEVLLKLKEEFSRLEILEDSDKQHGPKVIALYKYAINNNIDYVFQTDSDGQTNPDEFDALWQARGEYDGQFGNRTERGDGKKRGMVEKVVCLLVRFFFGVKVLDANAPFRLMKVDALKKYVPKLPDNYFLPNIMITTYFEYYDEKRRFVPISFAARETGTNSINIPRIVKVGFKALGEFRRFKKDMKKDSKQ